MGDIMQKVKVMRASGHPLLLEDIEAYKEDFRQLFDKVQDKCTLGLNANDDPSVAMLRMQKLLARCESILMKKYNRVGEWDFIATPEKAVELMEEHGNIMLSRRRDSGELLYVILDEDMIQGM
jgi:hypothetical protein